MSRLIVSGTIATRVSPGVFSWGPASLMGPFATGFAPCGTRGADRRSVALGPVPDSAPVSQAPCAERASRASAVSCIALNYLAISEACDQPFARGIRVELAPEHLVGKCGNFRRKLGNHFTRERIAQHGCELVVESCGAAGATGVGRLEPGAMSLERRNELRETLLL